MGYKNAMDLFPSDLLAAIQNYTDGTYIYIPRKVDNIKKWGELKNSRHQLDKRNQEICELYNSGLSARELAEQYYLSIKTVYKIVSAVKKQ